MFAITELETQGTAEQVEVSLTCREASFALDLIKLLQTMLELQYPQAQHREILVFGVIGGIFIRGVIDEIRFDIDNYQLDLIEVKTRRIKDYPKKAQSDGNHFQVLLAIVDVVL